MTETIAPAEGRVAVVLAASKGLGRGCAEALGRAGMRLALCARGREDLDDTVKALEDAGVTTSGWVVDVSSRQELDQFFTEVVDTYGRVDVLVANAGGPPPGELADLDEADWQVAYELTLMSAVRSINAVVPGMRDNGYGRIVVIGSSSVRRPLPNLLLSNVFRPGLTGLVKSLAVDLAPHGITVNMVSPGRVATDRVRDLDERKAQRSGMTYEEARAASEATIPMGRYGDPRDLGAMVRFLTSEEAGYTTGQSILVDGALVPTLP